MQITREQTGLASIGSCNDTSVAKYVCYACAINLQTISDVLNHVWTFSIALDMSTHTATSYLDIRIRFHVENYGIANIHLLVLLVYECHSGEVIFDAACKALNALYGGWRNKLIRVSTDRERKMTGCIKGVTTCFQKVSKCSFICVWCRAHQLDIILQDVYVHFGREEFYRALTSIISYLRRQYNFIERLCSKAPKVADTHWESMSKVSAWFKKYCVPVLQYLQSKNPACAPSHVWWAEIMVVADFSKTCTIMFKKLQGHSTTVGNQRAHLKDLQRLLMEAVNCKGPLSRTDADVVTQTTPADADVATPSSGADVTTGTPTRRYLKSTGDDVFAVKLDDMEAFIADLGSFAQSMVEGIPAERKNAFIEDIAHLYINTIAGIHRIEAERDEDNTAADSKVLPAVLAHKIAAMSHSRFCAVV